MTGRRRALATALAVAVLAVAGGACSSGPAELDRSQAEDAVAAAVADAVTPEVATVTCPDGVEQVEGGRFGCTAELVALGPLRTEVRQVDGDGRLEVELLDAVLADAAVAEQLEAELRRTFGRDFTADCGDARFRIWSPGDTFPCRADDGAGRRSVDVTVVDAAGTLSFEVLPPAD